MGLDGIRLLSSIGGPAPGTYASTSFSVIQTPSGTSPTAEVPDDTLILTSSDGSLTITGNATTDTVDFSANVAFFSELAQDAVGTILTDSTTIHFTYSDAIPSITANIIAGSVANISLADMVQATIKGRASGAGTGSPQDLTAAQIAAIVGTAIDHNTLTSLTVGDVHTQYAFLAGRSGGQSLRGGTAASNNLTLSSTSNATKGKILLGSGSAFNETLNLLGIGVTNPTSALDIAGDGSITGLIQVNTDRNSGTIIFHGNLTGPDEQLKIDLLNNTIYIGEATAMYSRGPVQFNANQGDYDTLIKGQHDAQMFALDASTDRVGIGTAGPDAKLQIFGYTDELQFLVRGVFTGQTANLMELWNSAGDPLVRMDAVGGAVFNEQGSASADFRVEGDTVSNLFFVDASADRIGIGTSLPAAKLEIVAGTLDALAKAFSMSYTLDSTAGAENIGSLWAVTSAGSEAVSQRGIKMTMSSGYTGSSQAVAIRIENNTASSGNSISSTGFTGNGAVSNNALGSGALNVGSHGSASGGTARNVGSVGLSSGALTSQTNIGVYGIAQATGTTSLGYGGFFALDVTSTNGSALACDNLTTTNDIFRAQDNGTIIFTIKDGGQVIIANAGTTTTPALRIGSTAGLYMKTAGSTDQLVAVTTGADSSFMFQNLSSTGFSGPSYLEPGGGVAVFTGYNNNTGEFRFNNVATSIGKTPSLNFIIDSTSAVIIDSSRNIGIGTSTFGTSAAKVFALTNGATAPTSSPADIVQIWGKDTVAGQANLYTRNENGKIEQITGLADRVSTQFDTTSTTLANITGLSHDVEAGKAYAFVASIYTTSNIAGGIKSAIAGTATATSIIYESIVIQTGTTIATTASRSTALGGTVSNVTAVTVATIVIRGTILVNAAGTLTVQLGANVAVGTTSALVGSSWILKPIGD